MQVLAGAEYGGAESFFTRLTIALHKSGLSQRVAIRENEARSALLRNAGVSLIQLKFGGAFDIRTTMSLRREVKEFQPDVVMSWMS